MSRSYSAVHILQKGTKEYTLKKNVSGLALRQPYMMEIKYTDLVQGLIFWIVNVKI